jgi:hypothetical protein
MSLFGAESIFGDVISDGLASLQSAVTAANAPGITNPGGMVQRLQAAGNAAVGVVGPAIDVLSGSDSKTMLMTQRVWQRNGILSTINSGSTATQADLQNAVSIASDMASQYGVANRYAKSVGVKPKPAYVTPTAASSRAVYSAAAAASPVVAPPSPSTALAAIPDALAAMDTKTIAAVSSGGVLGLLLGGAMGLRAGARLGLFLGGPLGGLVGAGAGWGLLRFLNPAPVDQSPQTAVASK